MNSIFGFLAHVIGMEGMRNAEPWAGWSRNPSDYMNVTMLEMAKSEWIARTGKALKLITAEERRERMHEAIKKNQSFYMHPRLKHE